MTLIEQIQAVIKARLGRDGANLVKTVDIYGGEFNATEIGSHSMAAPAVLITCLGWSDADGKGRIAGKARSVKFAFFIVTKNTNRTERMQQAIGISERLCGLLIDWRACGDTKIGCVGEFKDISAENLYGRASDKNGLGLWLVRASIDVSYCALTKPLVDHGGDMKQFMATLIAPTYMIETNAVTSVDEPPTEPLPQIEQTIDLNAQPIGEPHG